VLSIGQTTLPEKVKLRHATVDSSRNFGNLRYRGDVRPFALRPIRTAYLGAAGASGAHARPLKQWPDIGAAAAASFARKFGLEV
jgi:hypothetical protein